MNFERAFRLSSYGLVTLGILAVVISGELPFPILFTPLLAGYLAEHPRLRARIERIPVFLINTLSLCVFISLTAYYVFLADALIKGILFFTVYLQILKVLTGRKSRDYFQMYLLALAHLILTTLFTIDETFLIPFLLFIVMAPWCLTLFNLKTQLEAAHLGPEAQRDPVAQAHEHQEVSRIMRRRDIVSGRFFAVTALLSILLLAHTMAIFFAFPRVSFGFLSRDRQFGARSSGFSEQVDLSAFGEIKLSDSVVMRVLPADIENVEPDALYYRGMAFDVYDGTQWSRANDAQYPRMLDQVSGGIRLRGGASTNVPTYKIYLESIATEVLFLVDQPQAARWDPVRLATRFAVGRRGHAPRSAQLLQDAYDAWSFRGQMNEERVYTVYARDARARPALLRRVRNALPTRGRDAYRSVPDMSRRFDELAAGLSRASSNDYDRVLGVMKHLADTCTYTLETPRPGPSPIDTFLFEQRRGHCEYFATAAALLLREMNIPARLVSGYRGGDWNNYADYITVRQRDAHTWIEVWFDGNGWQRFDPTPPDYTASGFREIRFSALRELIEAIQLRWYDTIINYEVDDQYAFLMGAYARMQNAMDGLQRVSGGSSVNAMLDALRKGQGGSGSNALGLGLAGLLLALLVLGLTIYLLRTHRRRTRNEPGGNVRFYRRYLHWARKQGLQPEAAETPLEFAARVARSHPKARSQIAVIAHSYHRVRYGRMTLAPQEQQGADAAVHDISRLEHDTSS